MPRLNRTFSSADIVRIWTNHLTKDERTDIVCFFNEVNKLQSKPRSGGIQRTIIGLLIQFLPKRAGGGLVEKLEDVLDAVDELGNIVACGRRAQRVSREAGINLQDLGLRR